MDKEVVELYLDDIIPNRFQPREVFNEEALQELSASIKEHGVIQPIIVRKIGDKYEIIAGERRYKATALAGLTKIPAIIRNLDDKEASKVALLENLQRRDLTAIEEARTFQKILELDSMTQEELGKTMGKSQSAIANKMRLLSLPDEVQEALLNDKISERHARSLLNLETADQQISMLNRVIEERMTVRELDNEIRVMNGEEPIPSKIIAESGPKVEVKTEDAFDIIPDLEEEDEDDIFRIIPDLEEEELLDIATSKDTSLKTIDELLKKTKNYTMSDAVNEIKTTTSKLKNKDFKIDVEEKDFENSYEIIIKIDKK